MNKQIAVATIVCMCSLNDLCVSPLSKKEFNEILYSSHLIKTNSWAWVYSKHHYPVIVSMNILKHYPCRGLFISGCAVSLSLWGVHRSNEAPQPKPTATTKPYKAATPKLVKHTNIIFTQTHTPLDHNTSIKNGNKLSSITV